MRGAAVRRGGGGWLAGFAGLALLAVAACRAPEPLPVLSELPEFALIERSGATLDKAALAGRPAIVDFIFTRCPASCPCLTARMKELEKRIPESSTVRLLSITVDPEHDRPEVLTRYADGWQAGPRWLFATGERAAIWELVRKGFLMAVEATPEDTSFADPAQQPVRPRRRRGAPARHLPSRSKRTRSTASWRISRRWKPAQQAAEASTGRSRSDR